MKTFTMYRPNAVQNALGGFDRYFESFLGDSILSPAAKVFTQALAPLTPLTTPAVDIRETENSYMLEMELPGYEEKDINVNVDGANLSVSSKHEEKQDSKDSGETWLLKERRFSSFSRSFKLPENANPEEISAEFKNGILSMEIKKRPEAQKRTIQINVK